MKVASTVQPRQWTLHDGKPAKPVSGAQLEIQSVWLANIHVVFSLKVQRRGHRHHQQGSICEPPDCLLRQCRHAGMRQVGHRQPAPAAA
jgi:hypothetical protein